VVCKCINLLVRALVWFAALWLLFSRAAAFRFAFAMCDRIDEAE
jgi:hypothetical protein